MTAAIAPAPAPPEERRLRRAVRGRMLTGVARGLSNHLGLSVVPLRLGLIVLSLFFGLGAMLYVAFWAVLPRDADPAGARTRSDLRQLPAFVALGAGVLIVQITTGWGGTNMILGWLIVLVAAGAGLIWQQADPAQRRRWSAEAGGAAWLAALFGRGGKRVLLYRMLGGTVLVLVGVVGVVAVVDPSRDGQEALLNSLMFTAIGVVGIGIVLGPMVWRMMTQLSAEREAHAREQERAEVAGMIHDQVLHTLALIQRRAEDPREVARLARGQERTLRNWLYKPTAEPTEKLSAAIDQVAAEVDEVYGLTVDVVCVGDCDVDGPTVALVAATRESLVNVARHAGVDTVSVYAEVEEDQISVFVRDRGAGFDVDAVLGNEESDRHGVRGSIIGRMKRHGGDAKIISEPGAGTEVRLSMPREKE
ncbi:histidine kinase [Actinorhabdospora filicis]|uniref:Histidine kinase n=1 Tax=Actinorhabdospora filicis TaxID=1785913 RepID=A0A9W6SIM2_9ACTN|nr:ATP-binding protein [Actinorhabdospora filicis]GLZ76517.1 histidine kinase [Actinorhabdospora filicis]